MDAEGYISYTYSHDNSLVKVFTSNLVAKSHEKNIIFCKETSIDVYALRKDEHLVFVSSTPLIGQLIDVCLLTLTPKDQLIILFDSGYINNVEFNEQIGKFSLINSIHSGSNPNFSKTSFNTILLTNDQQSLILTSLMGHIKIYNIFIEKNIGKLVWLHDIYYNDCTIFSICNLFSSLQGFSFAICYRSKKSLIKIVDVQYKPFLNIQEKEYPCSSFLIHKILCFPNFPSILIVLEEKSITLLNQIQSPDSMIESSFNYTSNDFNLSVDAISLPSSSPIFITLSEKGDLYMLNPYINDNSSQLIYLIHSVNLDYNGILGLLLVIGDMSSSILYQLSFNYSTTNNLSLLPLHSLNLLSDIYDGCLYPSLSSPHWLVGGSEGLSIIEKNIKSYQLSTLEVNYQEYQHLSNIFSFFLPLSYFNHNRSDSTIMIHLIVFSFTTSTRFMSVIQSQNYGEEIWEDISSDYYWRLDEITLQAGMINDNLFCQITPQFCVLLDLSNSLSSPSLYQPSSIILHGDIMDNLIVVSHVSSLIIIEMEDSSLKEKIIFPFEGISCIKILQPPTNTISISTSSILNYRIIICTLSAQIYLFHITAHSLYIVGSHNFSTLTLDSTIFIPHSLSLFSSFFFPHLHYIIIGFRNGELLIFLMDDSLLVIHNDKDPDIPLSIPDLPLTLCNRYICGVQPVQCMTIGNTSIILVFCEKSFLLNFPYVPSSFNTIAIPWYFSLRLIPLDVHNISCVAPLYSHTNPNRPTLLTFSECQFQIISFDSVPSLSSHSVSLPIPQPYIIRRVLFDENENKMFLAITRDHNQTQEIYLCNGPINNLSTQLINSFKNHTINSLCLYRNPSLLSSILCVGTSNEEKGTVFLLQYHPIPSLLYSVNLKKEVYCLSQYSPKSINDTFLLIGSTHLIVTHYISSFDSILNVCQIQMKFYVSSIACSNDHIVISDHRDGIFVYILVSQNNQFTLQLLHCYPQPKLTRQVTFSSQYQIWNMDLFGNISRLHDLKEISETNSIHINNTNVTLKENISFSYHTVITKMIPYTFHTFPGKSLTSLLFLSIAGGINILLPLTFKQFLILSELESRMLKHPFFRPLSDNLPYHYRSQLTPSQRVVDFNLLISFLNLTFEQQSSIVEDWPSDLSFHQLDQLSNTLISIPSQLSIDHPLHQIILLLERVIATLYL